jgi:hypothetical protein
MKKSVLFMCVISIAAVSFGAAQVIYQDDFSGLASSPLNGTTPDVTTGSTTWVAGANFAASGKITYDNVQFGDSVYLPFVPQSGHIYTLSATAAASESSYRSGSGNGDWIALGFTQGNATPAARFFNDIPANNPVYWMLTRAATGSNTDQCFTGPTTTGQTNSSTSKATNLKIVLDTQSSTWKVTWTFNTTSYGPTDVLEANKTYFQYVALSTNRCDGQLSSFALTNIPLVAWNPTPANNVTDVSGSSVVFQWNKALNTSGDPNSHITSHTLEYISYETASAPTDPNFLLPTAVKVTGISATGATAQYPISGGLAFNTDKTVFWRVSEINEYGTTTVGPTWRFDTAKSIPIITTQPVNKMGASGETVDFTAAATSTTPLTYKWYKSSDATTGNDEPYVFSQTLPAGSSSSTYSVTVSSSQEAYYYCILSNSGPTAVTSTVVTLGMKRTAPLAYWKLDVLGGINNAQYVDETGNHNADPNSTPTMLPGKIGYGAVVTLASGYASSGTWNPSQFGNQFTVSLWAKWYGHSFPVRYQGLIAKENVFGASTMMWQLEVDQSTGALAAKSGTSTVSSATNLPNGVWQHVVMTFDGTTMTIYRDGVAAVSGGFVLGTATAAPVIIGASAKAADTSLYSFMFNGMLDDIRIYNYGMSKTEVADLYKAVEPTVKLCIQEYLSNYDINKDCIVDFKDFAGLASSWLSCGLYPASDCGN